MLRKGLGLIHYLKRNPYAKSGQTLNEKNGLVEFKDIQKGTRLRRIYNKATREKKKYIDGEEGDEFIPLSEHRQELEKAREKAQKEARNEIITKVYSRLNDLDDDELSTINRFSGISQSMLGEAVGISQQQVGNIVRDNT